MSETYYHHVIQLIASFNHRKVLGHALTDDEAVLHEQLCRLIESQARALRENWERMTTKTEDDV